MKELVKAGCTLFGMFAGLLFVWFSISPFVYLFSGYFNESSGGGWSVPIYALTMGPVAVIVGGILGFQVSSAACRDYESQKDQS